MRSLALLAGIFLYGSVSIGQIASFDKVELHSNVLAVGEVSWLRISGGKQPFNLSFLLRGEAREMPIAEAKSFLIGQVTQCALPMMRYSSSSSR